MLSAIRTGKEQSAAHLSHKPQTAVLKNRWREEEVLKTGRKRKFDLAIN